MKILTAKNSVKQILANPHMYLQGRSTPTAEILLSAVFTEAILL